MQESHKTTIGISPICQFIKSECSCDDCDSATCFAKRRMVPRSCECKDCNDSKSCLFYNNINLSESKSGSLNIKDIEIEIIKELLKEEIPIQDKNTHVLKEKEPKNFAKEEIAGSSDKNENMASKEHSVSAANSLNAVSPSIAKLSAKVMDVSYKDFQKSLSKPRFPPSLNTISPYDIFSRIKEAYKACSCKVCECLVGKSVQSDECRCKPCECSDCVTYSRQVKSFNKREDLFPYEGAGCPCISCDRSSCKDVEQGKNNQKCHCVGVLKYNYLKSSISTRTCECQPCQCIECEPRSIHRHKAMVVAPVGEDISHRNECQCSTCECFECGRGFRLSSHLHNEMSTSVNRHPQCQCEMCVNEACIPDNNQVCSCTRQSKVMSKPFQQESHDYDIRRAAITYSGARRHKDANYDNDTIAMFAAISNTFPESEVGNRRCDCDQCECLNCKFKEHIDNSFEPIQRNQLRKSLDRRYFSPSESTFCTKQDFKPRNTTKPNTCRCSECDCLNCEELANCSPVSDRREREINSEKSMSSCIGDICVCSNCRCESCVKDNYSKEVIYPIKKGEKLTPTIFRRKLKDAFIESCINTLAENDEIIEQTKLKSSLKKTSAFSPYGKTKTRYDATGALNKGFSDKRNCQANNLEYCLNARKVKHTHMSCNNDISSDCRNNKPLVETNFSTYSSMSYLNESESNTPARYKLKSWESSCNSSGYDCPNYLVHFPKITVETCLNDVIQSDNNNVRKFNTDMDISAKKRHAPQTPINSQLGEEPFEYSPQVFNNYINGYQTSKTTSKVAGKPRGNKTDECLRLSRAFERLSPINTKKDFTVNADYKRVQNTLKEAREFSMNLIQLLEKYEKANREFESVTEKIKKSNHSLLKNVNTLEHSNMENNQMSTLCMDQVPTRDHHQNSAKFSLKELVQVRECNTESDNLQFFKDPITTSEDNARNSLQNIAAETSNNVSDTNEGRNESGDDINKINETLKTITEEKEPFDLSQRQEKKRKVLAKLHKKYNKMYKRTVMSSKRIKNSTNSSNFEGNANDTENANSSRITQEKPNNTVETKTDMGDSKVTLPQSPESINLLELVKKSTTELRVSVTEKFAEDQHVFQKDVVMIKEPLFEHNRQIIEIKEGKQWPMSNIFRDVYLPTALEMKETARAITIQPNHENATYLYKNRALIKLHFEVKKLLDLPILKNCEQLSQHNLVDILDNNLSKTSSCQTNQGTEESNSLKSNFAALNSKNSCDALKVNFLSVRRVSDHTVLVKWNTPHKLSNVQGYELLVDGRAVQKMLSPSRRIAVVTCLPHSDKVLLTVRTVLTTPRQGRSPATTVIYERRTR